MSAEAKRHDPATFHHLYGAKSPRISYYKKDFLDYVVMIALSAGIAGITYGPLHPMSIAGYALCAFMLAMFITRHGVELTVPLIVRRPQDVLYTLLYKVRNLSPMYLIAVALLLLENVAIARTPGLPHHAELLRTISLYLFYTHFAFITLFRTRILIDHLRKKELVREVLTQTAWKRVIREKTNVTLEIVHAYCSGLLAHIILIAPWYLVIRHFRFSVVFLPVVCAIDLVIHMKWMKAINAWFYRDHWLGHNSELEFLFLHGSHHDAIPSALIAVAENGFLEGFLRLSLGSPVTFYHPLMVFLISTAEVKMDMEAHQYIPGIYPKLPKKIVHVSQHSTHHYGPIEPYSFGIKVDQPNSPEDYSKLFGGLPDELKNSAKLDEELTGFVWDNPTHRRTITLYDKYHN
jgi:hypothetical protein